MAVTADGRIALLAARQLRERAAMTVSSCRLSVKFCNGEFMGKKIKLRKFQQRNGAKYNVVARPRVSMSLTTDVAGEAKLKDYGMEKTDPRTVVAIILGGGAGTRLFPLTKRRAKPAVPIGGAYRLIDVPMSNCINSGINKVYILTQFNSASLNRHLARAYNFGSGVTFGDGYVEVLAATQTPGEAGKRWFQGTADAVRQFHWLFEDPRSKDIEDVLILSGDHLYRMDYMDFVQSHRQSGADITISSLPIDDRRASDFGLMKIDDKGRVLFFSEKPKGDDLKAMAVDTSVLGLSPEEAKQKPIIRACAGLSARNAGQQVHGYVLTSGLALDSFVQSSLVHMYVKCNNLKDAHKVFDTMPSPDVVSWSALAAGYAKNGDVVNAGKVFSQAGRLGIERNSVSWNGVIAGFNQSGCFLEAVSVFQEMHCRGFMADGTSISSVLPAIGDLGDLSMGIQVHGCVIKLGFKSDICIISSLIDMYGKCSCALEMSKVFEEIDQKDVGTCNAMVAGLSRNGLVDDAFKVFKQCRDEGMELNVVSWTSMIASCSQHGKDVEALELFREMQRVGMEPNCVTIPCLLPACGNIAALMHGKAAHCFSLKRGFADDVYVASALVDMYANCGRVDLSRLTFNRMPTRNLVSWNALIGGYAMHGKATEAIEILRLMQSSGHKPDAISFTSILSACSQVGLSDEGQHYFDIMSKDHKIEARLEHYACMVSLLGRAGKLEEAYSLIKKMPFEPDACVWGALLGSCKIHHNMSLGEVAANKLFQLEPKSPGNYILLSNIYASNRRWNEVDRIRDMMKQMGLRKNPGCSWIELKNKVHMLLAGDKSHPQMTQIMIKLAKLSLEMKKSGVLPNTDFVLQDVEEEEEKEHILCGHSEKLAVVLGILNTSRGSPLRVIKNLRICGDCHSFMKFTSSFEGREIFVRDTNRFHHFKDGACSCMDYW